MPAPSGIAELRNCNKQLPSYVLSDSALSLSGIDLTPLFYVRN